MVLWSAYTAHGYPLAKKILADDLHWIYNLMVTIVTLQTVYLSWKIKKLKNLLSLTSVQYSLAIKRYRANIRLQFLLLIEYCLFSL